MQQAIHQSTKQQCNNQSTTINAKQHTINQANINTIYSAECHLAHQPCSKPSAAMASIETALMKLTKQELVNLAGKTNKTTNQSKTTKQTINVGRVGIFDYRVTKAVLIQQIVEDMYMFLLFMFLFLLISIGFPKQGQRQEQGQGQ